MARTEGMPPGKVTLSIQVRSCSAGTYGDATSSCTAARSGRPGLGNSPCRHRSPDPSYPRPAAGPKPRHVGSLRTGLRLRFECDQETEMVGEKAALAAGECLRLGEGEASCGGGQPVPAGAVQQV